MTALTEHTLRTVRDAIAAGETSSVDMTRAYLDRIAAHNDRLKAFNEVYADRALQRAKAADDGKLTGPLAGVPIAIKDNFCSTYGRTSCASRILERFQAPYDATALRKLEAAGAVILGKTNMDEFAMGSSCEHSAFAATRNPWDPDRVPGGSSGGSAAALAADLAAGTLGSDTGGSIRQPAAFCGVVGLKPTYGLVSRYGLVAFASSLDQIGPFGRDVADAALLLSVLAGHDPMDSTSAPESVSGPIPDYTAEIDTPIENLTLGVAKQYLSDRNAPEVSAAVDAAIKQYESLGAELVEVDLPHTEYGVAAYYLIATAEASSNLARYDGVHYGYRADDPEDLIDLYARSRAEAFGDEVKRRIMLGTFALSSGYYDAYYLQALKVRQLIKRDFDEAFARCQAIICPPAPMPPFRIGEKLDDPVQLYMTDVYTVPCSLAGMTGVSLPAGMAELDGRALPLAVQLLGPAFSEHRLLRIARMFEQATDHHRRRPVLD